MKSAYLYVRVSTDEQKRKGYSLPEQEDRLLKYCDYNDIEVKDIFREDFSAKNFNRPEWKRLLASIRKKPSEGENSILFIKWDRFSRNIEYAYEMISLLRKYNTTVTAIDQPVDFSVPESTVMLAVYLSIPEAENSRRSLNTTNGIRKAKQMGRYPNKAPMGFINVTGWDGKKYIEVKQPEAGILQWAFQQLAKNSFKIDEVRKMACAKGLKCSRSYFVKLIRNPVYCGLICIQSDSEEQQTIKGVHTPIISESLFYEVQDIVNTKKKVSSKKDEIISMFFLKGFLTCPVCNRKLCGSFSRGCSKKYPYYHCSKNCKVRMRADLLNSNYDKILQRLKLSNKVAELFSSILQDVNISTHKAGYLQERRFLLKQIDEHELVLSKARKLFIADKLQFDDFKELKKEHRNISRNQKKELDAITMKLRHIDQRFNLSNRTFANIFNGFERLETADKKRIVSLITPSNIDIGKGEVSIKMDNALSKILLRKNAFQSIG